MTGYEVTGILALLAAGMAGVSAYSVKWAAVATGPLSASVVQFLLGMMAAMFIGILVYFAVGGAHGFVSGLWVAALIMSASVFVVLVGLAREIRLRSGSAGPVGTGFDRSAFLASVVALVLGNEALMGWSFSLLAGTLPISFGPDLSAVLRVLTGAVISGWFVFPMALEMVLSIWLLRPKVPPALARFLLVQPLIMICSPPTIAGVVWAVGSTAAGSVLMAVAVAWLLLALFRGREFSPPTVRYLLALFVSFGVMAGGLAVWAATSNDALFAVSLLGQMVVFLWAVTDLGRFLAPTGSAEREPLIPPPGTASG